MKQVSGVLMAAALCAGAAVAQTNPFLGRWDLTITSGSETYPDWLELSEKGGKLDAWIQPRSGGARHSTDVKLEGSRLIIAPGGGRGPVTTWELSASGDK